MTTPSSSSTNAGALTRSHTAHLPLELLYHIADLLAIPPHPLSYDLPRSSQHALLSLSLTCHIMHDHCMPLLYRRICIESASRLRRLRRARRMDLKRVTAVFLDFDHLEDEVRLPIPAQDADITGSSYKTFYGFSPRAALYYEVSENLSFLISACRSSLQRLAFGSRSRPNTPWEPTNPIEERAVEQFNSQASYAIASTLPGLRELICVRQNMEIGDYLGLGRSGGQRRWEKLERLAVYGSLSYNAQYRPPILPALECFCVLHPFASLGLLSQAVETSPNLRELTLFDGSVPLADQTQTVRNAARDLDRICEALEQGKGRAPEVTSVLRGAGAAGGGAAGGGGGVGSVVPQPDYEADTFTGAPLVALSPTSSSNLTGAAFSTTEREHRNTPVHVTRLSLPVPYDPRQPEDRRERTSVAARLGREGLLWEWMGEDVSGVCKAGREVVGLA